MKKFLVILLLIMFLPLSADAMTIPVVSKDEKIHDFAQLLTEEEEKNLQIEIDDLIAKTNYDFVFVTINDSLVTNSHLYAIDFYDNNKYGIDIKHSGIIILIDMYNREVIFDVTGDAILVYDDIRQKSITDLMASYLTEENYFEGVTTGIKRALEYHSIGIPDSNKDYCVNDDGEYYKCVRRTNWTMSGIIGIALSLIISLTHIKKYKQIRLASDANDYLKGGVKGESIDTFKFTTTNRVRVRSESSGGGFGGGGGGGSTISSGSSGSSHSGSSSRF